MEQQNRLNRCEERLLYMFSEQDVALTREKVSDLLRHKNAYGVGEERDEGGGSTTRWNMITYKNGKKSKL